MLATACRNDTFHGYHSKIWPIMWQTKKNGIRHLYDSFFLTPSSVFCQASSYALIWLEITFDWRIVKVPSIHLFDLFVPDWHHVSRCILTLESNLFQLIKMHCLYTLHTLTHLLTLTTFVPIRPICCSTEFRLKARYSCVRGHFDFQPKCTSFLCSASVILVKICEEVARNDEGLDMI